jgi:hypothetical protein
VLKLYACLLFVAAGCYVADLPPPPKQISAVSAANNCHLVGTIVVRGYGCELECLPGYVPTGVTPYSVTCVVDGPAGPEAHWTPYADSYVCAGTPVFWYMLDKPTDAVGSRHIYTRGLLCWL